MTADNWFKLYVNGRPVADGSNHKEAMTVDLAERLQAGKNVIAVDAANQGDAANPAGLLAFLKVSFADGDVTIITRTRPGPPRSRRHRLARGRLRRH